MCIMRPYKLIKEKCAKSYFKLQRVSVKSGIDLKLLSQRNCLFLCSYIFSEAKVYCVTVNWSVKIVYALSSFNSLTADNFGISFEMTCQPCDICAILSPTNK